MRIVRVQNISVARLRDRLDEARLNLAEVGPVDCEHPAARAVSRLEALLAQIDREQR